MNTFHTRLKELRLRDGLTQAQLSELSGISQNYISQIETGVRGHKVFITNLLNLANIFNVSVDYLIGRK